MNKPIVIYHKGCTDGFGAAWCFWNQYKDTYDYHPGVYQGKVPDVVDRDVFLVDFSYKRNVVEDILSAAKSVTLIDHHKSALEDLWDLETAGLSMKHSSQEHSGAVLAWNYVQWAHRLSLGKPKKMPQVLAHVEDYDLWKFNLLYTKEIMAYVTLQDFEFKVWDKMMSVTKAGLVRMIKDGGLLERKQQQDCARIAETSLRDAVIDDHPTVLVNAPSLFFNDVAERLTRTNRFVALYYDTKDYRNFGLRSHSSNPDALDVSEIAVRFGGGGHKHSAGFKVDRRHTLSRI
jgi:oligoribonuclease NrnB/cAMP/cGMP phosphodiesterase (DHH superfamily)